ncbi:MAG: NAD(P)/FAD-dependent oxidoreductase [Janthinobacterium lividum]
MADRHAAVVLGGGLAGTSLALQLAAAGRDVLLLERSRGPHGKVCGEFLSGEALHYLHQRGVQPEALGAVPIRQVRLASHGQLSSALLPFPAQSLTRLCLDEYLLQAAAAAGVEVRRGTHVNSLQAENGGWTIGLREGERVHTRDVFLATGKHDLRTQPRPAGTHTGLVGFKMYYRLQPAQTAALRGAVELALFPGGYAGLQPVEGGRANLCLLVDAGALRRCGGIWADLQRHMLQQSPHLQARLQGAEPLLDAPLTIASIPYGHVQRATEPGLWRLGDQAAVIPSFSGDGMSIALHSAALAARTYLRGDGSEAFQRELAGQMGQRLWLATALSRTLVQRPWMAQFAHLFPALLPRMASMTRIPNRFLLRTDAADCVDSLRQEDAHG